MNQQTNPTQGSQLSDNTRTLITNTSQMLDKLISQVREDVSQAREPKAQALFETSAEVLLGLKKAYDDYKGGGERAWQ